MSRLWLVIGLVAAAASASAGGWLTESYPDHDHALTFSGIRSVSPGSGIPIFTYGPLALGEIANERFRSRNNYSLFSGSYNLSLRVRNSATTFLTASFAIATASVAGTYERFDPDPGIYTTRDETIGGVATLNPSVGIQWLPFNRWNFHALVTTRIWFGQSPDWNDPDDQATYCFASMATSFDWHRTLEEHTVVEFSWQGARHYDERRLSLGVQQGFRIAVPDEDLKPFQRTWGTIDIVPFVQLGPSTGYVRTEVLFTIPVGGPYLGYLEGWNPVHGLALSGGRRYGSLAVNAGLTFDARASESLGLRLSVGYHFGNFLLPDSPPPVPYQGEIWVGD